MCSYCSPFQPHRVVRTPTRRLNSWLLRCLLRFCTKSLTTNKAWRSLPSLYWEKRMGTIIKQLMDSTNNNQTTFPVNLIPSNESITVSSLNLVIFREKSPWSIIIAIPSTDESFTINYPQVLWGFLSKVFNYLHRTNPTGSSAFIILKVYGASSQRSSITCITQIRQGLSRSLSSRFMGLPPKGLRLPASHRSDRILKFYGASSQRSSHTCIK